MRITNLVGVLGLLIVTLSLGACGGLTKSDQPALKTWWLEPYTSMKQKESAEVATVVSVSVTAVPGLDTNRILTLSRDAELQRYSAARWADNLPELITSLAGRSLEMSGRFEVVSKATGSLSEDCDLALEVREFFARLGPSGQTTGVSIAIDGYYLCESGSPVSIQLSASIPVHGVGITGIIAGFQQAMDRVMEELLGKI